MLLSELCQGQGSFSHLQSGTEVPPTSQMHHKIISPSSLFTNMLLATDPGFEICNPPLTESVATALNRVPQKHLSFLLSLERRSSFSLLQHPKSVPPGLTGILKFFQIKEQKEKQQQLPSEMAFYCSLQLYKGDSVTSVPIEVCPGWDNKAHIFH